MFFCFVGEFSFLWIFLVIVLSNKKPTVLVGSSGTLMNIAVDGLSYEGVVLSEKFVLP